MKKLLLVGLLAVSVVWSGCKQTSLVVTLEAQSLPITKTAAWDAPVGGGADSYIVKLDGTQVGTPIGLSQQVTFTSLGSHTLTVQSVSALWGAGGTASLTVNVVVPANPANVRLQ